jgi:hypothetical protein
LFLGFSFVDGRKKKGGNNHPLPLESKDRSPILSNPGSYFIKKRANVKVIGRDGAGWAF